MTVISDAIGAIKDALKLSDEVKRAGATLGELSREVREHDRRITRLEAQWETAIAFTRPTTTAKPQQPRLNKAKPVKGERR
jgi:hypothetical protein